MLRSVLVAAFIGAGSVLAVDCSLDSHCPEATPCCSQYGECGTGAFCLGGCDPLTSFKLESCVPAPVCQNKELKFDSLDRIKDISEYLGDPKEADWVASGEPLIHDGTTLLTMPKDSVGTVLSSTTYMWYGNVKARMKTSRGRGVVTAFILFSDVKDEIDYEFVGVDLETAQTNFYFQGIPNYENSENITVTDSFFNFHDYEVRWTPDKIEWVIDGKVGRSKDRKDTWNATSNQWEFPQTPARVQLSLWPAGLASNPEGTIDWAGGEIDWNADDVTKVGYFWATVESVSIECYDGSNGLGTNSGTSYTYNNLRGTNDTVVDGDKKTVIASLQATGTDMDKGKKAESDDDDDDDDNNNDDSNNDDDSDDDEPAATVPGGVSPGQDHSGDNQAENGGSNNDNNSNNSGGDNSNTDQPATPDAGNPCSDTTTFCDPKNSNSDGATNGNSGTKSGASMLAMIIAGAALFWL